ncbi:hemerythrin domain-containing protein [Nocardioides sp.]|uniref:hemerythrin domain-containing protein n=1 Tax=Nocardioides sp. TaxID=35761 RepID=UPI002604349E|nr:hemerythrin domain-containing protein [Nocardioides sp.]
MAHQSHAALGGPLSVLVRQKRDHVRLDRLIGQLKTTTGREQDRVLLQLRRLVFPHAFAEESVLWPVMRRVVPDGEALTRQVEQEHQEVNELVLRLDEEQLTPSERPRLVNRLIKVLREDVRDEEDSLLPELQRELTVSELRRLGVAWEVVRRTAPTRPHPVVSRRPPGNVLAALPLSVLDNARDLCEVAALRAPRAAGPMHLTGRALGRAATRVERIGLMRRGENPTTHVAESDPAPSKPST